MVNIKDIAKILAARHTLSNADAEIFIQMIVEVINEGLFQDRQVKIKGFGTFKLQTVKERTSVNVNTGEKVVIGEHDKVSFTPDNMMKDLINKPFAQFETVPVDDDSPLLEGKDLPDIEIDVDEEAADNVEAQEEVLPKKLVTPVVEEEVEQPQSVINTSEEKLQEVTEEAKQEETEDVIPPVTREESREEVESVVADDGIMEEAAEEAHEECDMPNPRCRNIFIYYGVIINIVIAVCAFALGYLIGDQHWFTSTEETQPVVAVSTKTKQQPKAQQAPMATAPVAPKEKPDTVKVKPEVPKVEKKEKAKAQEPVQTADYDKDVRIRTGAYYIIGTDVEVTVKEGQTLSSISRAYLGEGMECYVEAYNNIKKVNKGDKIKIPKLQLKKAARKKQ